MYKQWLKSFQGTVSLILKTVVNIENFGFLINVKSADIFFCRVHGTGQKISKCKYKKKRFIGTKKKNAKRFLL